MASVAIRPPARLRPLDANDRHRLRLQPLSSLTKDEAMASHNNGNDISDTLNMTRKVAHVGISFGQSHSITAISCLTTSSEPSFRFDRLLPQEHECDFQHKKAFGRFIAREAILDEEYWTAAWLRAESHLEDQSGDRYIESHKRKYTEQEFNRLKARHIHRYEKNICLVAVKNDEKSIKRTVLSSIVGTLDVNIRHLLQGELYPKEVGAKSSIVPNIYQAHLPVFGYISNLCVAKYARRQGIAKNMLLLAIEAAKEKGAEKIFVHVHKANEAAQRLYDQIGFKLIFDMNLRPSENYLLSISTS